MADLPLPGEHHNDVAHMDTETPTSPMDYNAAMETIEKLMSNSTYLATMLNKIHEIMISCSTSPPTHKRGYATQCCDVEKGQGRGHR
jgi:hypothetical protein|uniref:Uncharacterized protein n=2 Tax=Picea TaxID=3328 RepID=A0A124GN61_PICGL|nr:hypothetical protein ABT39_MTgene4791 [Picea glauca]QHR91681.1 hypothetical protein Q903MT_gene5717 [Picea sitchensis]